MTALANALQMEPRWYALYVRSRHEKRAAEHLLGRGIEAFLPTYRSLRLWKNRTRVELEIPLFPGYLFVRILPTNPSRVSVLQSPGALSLVGNGENPVAIVPQEVEMLQATLRMPGIEPHPYLKAGERVRVIAGPMAGMEGVLVRFKQNYRVVLSVDLIMRSLSVEIDLCDLERVAAAPTLIPISSLTKQVQTMGTYALRYN